MKKLTIDQMRIVQGGDVWSALLCGAFIGSLFLAPTPMGVVGAIASCGRTIAD